MGRLSSSSPRSRWFVRICAIGESARWVREIGRLPKIRTPGAQTGRCARRRATITPARWDGIGGQRDRRATSSIDGSTQCAQPGGVRFPLPSAGDPPDRLWPHHTGHRTVAATPAAVPIDLGDGGRCGGQNSSSSSSMNSVGSASAGATRLPAPAGDTREGSGGAVLSRTRRRKRETRLDVGVVSRARTRSRSRMNFSASVKCVNPSRKYRDQDPSPPQSWANCCDGRAAEENGNGESSTGRFGPAFMQHSEVCTSR